MNCAAARCERVELLESAGHNLSLVPDARVEVDCLTDSLMHRPPSSFHGLGRRTRPGSAEQAVEELAAELFGFPHVIVVSQGRLAEAILSRALVRAGHCVPCSALFPTTRLHLERNGATCVELVSDGARELDADHPFKGDVDVAGVERAIHDAGARAVPLVCVEPCNNAIGGHPMSMANVRALGELTARYGVPLYLDASRVIDNAVLIQEREPPYRNVPLRDIVREFCSYAAGLTASATKDFVTPIGGLLATRDAHVFERCLDEVALFGRGLSSGALEPLAVALSDPERVFARVVERVRRVAALHAALVARCPLTRPSGGHAVFVNLDATARALPERLNPEQAFLYALFEEFGVRGAMNPSARAASLGAARLARFAIPIIDFTTPMLERVARGIEFMIQNDGRLRGLEKISQPGGLTGSMRAKFRPSAALVASS